MDLHVIGINHRTAPVALREALAVEEDRLPEVLRHAVEIGAVRECVALSTCNRVELYALTDSGEAGHEALTQMLLSRAPASAGDSYAYHRAGHDAVLHLFRVATGLDSMVLGEPQILGQLKDSWRQATNLGAADNNLGRIMERAFSVAKRARSTSGLGASSVSMGSVAAELALKVFGSLDKRSVLLVGAGKIGGLVARHLRDRGGAEQLFILNRSLERAQALAEDVGAIPGSLDELSARLEQADVVVVSTGARSHVIDRKGMRTVMKRRRGRPILMIDLAVPRNLDPEINRIEDVFLFDTDDMEQVVDSGQSLRREQAKVAEAVVAEAATGFDAWLRKQSLTPTIVSLRTQLLELARGEAARTAARLGQKGDPALEKALTAMADAIVNKVLHQPLKQLKRADGEEGAQLVQAVQRLFALGASEADAGSGTNDDATPPSDAPRPGERVGRA